MNRQDRYAQAVAAAQKVFENRETAERWMESRIPVLDGGTPAELLDSDEGLDTVLTILLRIEHGVFS